jgi:virginiamycin B lyase
LIGVILGLFRNFKVVQPFFSVAALAVPPTLFMFHAVNAQTPTRKADAQVKHVLDRPSMRLFARIAGRVLAACLALLPNISLAQTFTEFPLPTANSMPWGITKGPDGALWFAGGNIIGRITAAGVITEFPLSILSGSTGIATGPDGALWFTDPGANQIGRITTAGVITKFQLTGGGQPTGITAGPDGALWFTESYGNTIGRITIAGAITEFPLPTSVFVPEPTSITTGPDGALWFTEDNGNKIGRITTGGVITEFALPETPARFPLGITTGPDGALWFTESGPNQIGRITTAGVITEFPLPYDFLKQSTGITTGPDGALWFTENKVNKIGRITTAGVITEFPLPTATSGPYGITMGPDGALWFTESLANNIGRLAPGVGKNLGSDCDCGTAATRPSGEGNPINAGTGNKFQTETDFTADPHTGLGFTRYYNSQDIISNWRSIWHHGLTVSGNAVTVTRADGRQDMFTNNGSGVYTADPDVIDRLSPVPASSTQTGWELLKADDSIEAAGHRSARPRHDRGL